MTKINKNTRKGIPYPINKSADILEETRHLGVLTKDDSGTSINVINIFFNGEI